MKVLAFVVIGVVAVVVLVLAMSMRVVNQYQRGVLFRLGRVRTVREPGLTFIIPFVDVLKKVSLRIITMPVQS